MTDNIGSYEIRDAGGARVNFWPLSPGTTVAQALPPNPVAPGNVNPVVVATIGILDIVVSTPAGAPLARHHVANTGLGQVVAGAGVNSATLFANNDLAHLCCAVSTPNAANPFDGSLRLNVQVSGHATRLNIPIQVSPNVEEDDLFIAFALERNLSNYLWIHMRAVAHTGGAAIGNANVRIRTLRDNATVRTFNRISPAVTTATGFVAHGARDVVGVAINWPVIFDLQAANFLRRSQMMEFTAAQRTASHNNHPHTPTDVSMAASNESLAARRFMLDPGHGVVYADAARRSYEWFLAHRIATRVSTLLQNDHAVPAANITWTRTAGFGLISPVHVNANNAPATGHTRFDYDMTNRTVRIVNNALSMTDISDLLLTTHTNAHPFPAEPVPPARRAQLLASSPATVTAAVNRTAAGLAGRTVQPGTTRWDEPTMRYVFDTVPTANPAGPVQTHNIAINTTDNFTVTDAMLRNLCARSARWSLNQEGMGGGTAFQVAARNAMLAQGALDYMRDASFREADHPAGHVFLAHGIEGWAFGIRRQVMQAQNPVPDITLTFHHNAVGVDGQAARGNVMLASNAASATAAHLRLQKTFVKYVRGLETGLRERGIINTHGSALNNAPAALTSGYAFFENEFMNAGPPPAAGVAFEYERMVLPGFINRTAEEIVAAIVDFLVNPQPNADFDPVDVNQGISAGPVRW